MAVTGQVSGPLHAADYVAALRELMPPGPAWTDTPSAAVTMLFEGLAQELARVDARAWQLIEEADPRTTRELFADWERVAGLPDPCVVALAEPQTHAQRRAALVSKLVQRGGASRAYFIEVARALGFVISISEGWQRRYTVRSAVNASLQGTGWAYTWTIHAALSKTRTLKVNGRVNDPLASWGNTLLECVMRRLAPAHTTLLFSYT